MALKFDDILEHRETIVARIRRSWRLHGWFSDGTVNAVGIGGAVAAGLLGAAYWSDSSVPQNPEDILSHRLARLLYARRGAPPVGGTGHG